jgi:hypothetical protein
MYRPRLLTGDVERALRAFPVVAILGARQTGKTTLATDIARRRGFASVTLDDPRVHDAALRDPDGFLASNPPPLLIDEAQRAPDLFRAMKLAVDRRRRPGTYLITGSANYLLMRSVSESLAGRVALFELPPLSWPEWRGVQTPRVLAHLLAARSVPDALRRIGRRPSPPESALRERILRGGLPVPGAMRSADARRTWFTSYVQTYLERDLRDLARIPSLPDFARLLRLLALRTGRMVSYADLARDADLSPTTVRSYLGLAVVAYFVRLLPPFFTSGSKRLVKAPKTMLVDTGLAAHLAGAESWPEVERSGLAGPLVESWVYGQLLALLGRSPGSAELYFWRTHAGAEVDFVLASGRRLLPIEVKWSAAPRAPALRGIESFLAEFRDRAPFGVVLHRGTEPVALRARVLALPLAVAFE